ncbi:hypothetical protein QEH59_12780 [Coraliomargarita sp. SDUM461004]|uniref:DUF2933 domain-containing protein n=1 Tax=Thalassobacterium sedimentorum TaxID=3041258 RepID=A0ABU1AKS6_9BACT|nr:hypothetical protein [Coraliomargarita sp. SDUM461004]MDQ8195307.1 hypothetical protein [Coraliomargarita sp. SDUM461004]
MKHGFFHLLGCLIPIALIFILPAFGLSSGMTFTIFLVLMFGCHFMMMGMHGSHDPAHAQHDKQAEPKSEPGSYE